LTTPDMKPNVNYPKSHCKPNVNKDMKPTLREEQKARVALLLKLQHEKELRCGNGNGTYNHSVACTCLSLDPMIRLLKSNIKNADKLAQMKEEMK